MTREIAGPAAPSLRSPSTAPRGSFTGTLLSALNRPAHELRDLSESWREPGSKGSQMVALELLGCVVAHQALCGSLHATTLIAERLEGRVGTRNGEQSEISAEVRAGMQATIESVVEAFTNARRAGTNPLVIDADPIGPSPASMPAERLTTPPDDSPVIVGPTLPIRT